MGPDELAKRAANVVLAIQASGWEAAHQDFIAILNELSIELRDPPENRKIAQEIVDRVCKKT
jgi:hypothetical protein